MGRGVVLFLNRLSSSQERRISISNKRHRFRRNEEEQKNEEREKRKEGEKISPYALFEFVPAKIFHDRVNTGKEIKAHYRKVNG